MRKLFETTLIVAVCVTSLYLHSNYVVHNVKNTRDNLHKRIDVLVRDSVKTHKWIENVKANIKEYEP